MDLKEFKKQVERDGGVINWAFALVIIAIVEFILTGLKKMIKMLRMIKLRLWMIKKLFRIIKLRFWWGLGFKLTSDERSELAFWLTRKVTTSASETLEKMRDE